MRRNRALSRISEALLKSLVDGRHFQCDCACPTELDLPITSLPSPVFYYIELTPSCNNRCAGCGNVFVSDRSLPPLSLAQWRVVLTKLKPSAFCLKITGGEPTSHPELEGIVEAIRELNIPFALFSNGRWKSRERLLTFLRDIPQFKGFLISLHGATPPSHDIFTGVPGSFEETVENIRLAVAADLSVTSSTVITKYNYAEVGQIVCLSKKLGAHHAVFNRYLGHPLPAIEPTKWQLKKAMRRIDALGADGAGTKFGNCIPQCFCSSSSTGCLAGIAYCTIDPWGNVRPCNHAPLTCGNLLEQSIEEIWDSEAMEHWRSLISGQCESCLEFPKCHGGCRAVAMQLGMQKDPLMVKPVSERPDESAEELMFNDWERRVSRSSIRAEKFGYTLARDEAIRRAGHSVSKRDGGQTRGEQIEKICG